MAPVSLRNLHQHSIFIPSSTPGPSTPKREDDGWEILSAPSREDSEAGATGEEEPLVGHRKSKLAVRDRDVVILLEGEIRMTSLSASMDERDGRHGAYTVLKSPAVDFEVFQIIPNPSGRLIAVVGEKQLAVMNLPNSPSITTDSTLDCSAFKVDAYQFSHSSAAVITKVLWHPWGEGGQSLWILTSDGELREYDTRQPFEPIQTFSFLPEHTAPSSSRFSAADPFEQYATAFAFGPTETTGLRGLMVYVLIANGDVYTMGPIIPFKAEVPIDYLQMLRAFTTAQLSRQSDDVFRDGSVGYFRAQMQAQWVEHLCKQVKLGEEVRKRREETPPRRSSRQPSVAVQVAYTPIGKVLVHPPHLTEHGGPAPGVHHAVLRQGPLALSAGVREADDFDPEDAATDLGFFVLHADANEASTGEEGEASILVVAWASGSLDIGVEVDAPEPRWLVSRDSVEEELNVAVIETLSLVAPHPDVSPSQYSAAILSDPIYNEVFHLQHPQGVFSVDLGIWKLQLFDQVHDHPAASDVRQLVNANSKPIVGASVLCNISLGYAVLALASSGQLAALELDFHSAALAVTSQIDASTIVTQIAEVDEDDPASLLFSQAFAVDALLSDVRAQLARLSASAVKSMIPKPNARLQEISTTDLKTIGSLVALVQEVIQAIRQASEEVEHRLDVQLKEYQRQIRLVKEVASTVDALKASSTSRVEGLLAEQGTLEGRLNDVVGRLVGDKDDQLSEKEKQWIDDLQGLRVRVREGSGLAKKVLELEGQVKKLQAVKASSGEAPASEKVEGKQVRPLERSLEKRSDEINKLVKKVDALGAKLASVSVGEVSS